MANGLNDTEIGLVKKMLERGMRNSDIQFYFNRPDRRINSGRITGVKQGDLGPNVPTASEYELEEFLDKHPLTLANLGPDEPRTPAQSTAATQFIVTEDELIDVQQDTPFDEFEDNPDLQEFYDGLREAASNFVGMGHNFLGAVAQKADNFLEALPEDYATSSTIKIWMKGNALRMLLGAHDKVADSQDMHPAKLDAACAETLRHVVQAFNVYAANSAKANELDQLSKGPDFQREFGENLPEVEAAISDATNISTDATIDLLTEQLQEAKEADVSEAGARQVSVAGDSVVNFIRTVVVTSYRMIRSTTTAVISATWTAAKDKVVGFAGAYSLCERRSNTRPQ